MTWEIEICNQCKWEIPKGAKKCMHCGTNISFEKWRRGAMMGCLAIVGFIVLIVLIWSLSNSKNSNHYNTRDYDYSVSKNNSDNSSATGSESSLATSIDANLWNADISSWTIEKQTESILNNVESAVKEGNKLWKVSGIEAIVAKFWHFEVTARDWDNFATDNTKRKIEIIVNADADSCSNAKDIVFAIMKSIYTSKHSKSVSRIKVNIPYYIKVSLGSQHSWLKWEDLWTNTFIDSVQGHGREEIEKWKLDQITFWKYLSSCH